MYHFAGFQLDINTNMVRILLQQSMKYLPV